MDKTETNKNFHCNCHYEYIYYPGTKVIKFYHQIIVQNNAQMLIDKKPRTTEQISTKSINFFSAGVSPQRACQTFY